MRRLRERRRELRLRRRGAAVTTTFAGGERLDVGYDQRSRTRTESFVTAQGFALTMLLYEHDLADRRVRVANASGALQQTTFSDGRLAEQRTGNGLVRSFSYRADGLFTGATTRDRERRARGADHARQRARVR